MESPPHVDSSCNISCIYATNPLCHIRENRFILFGEFMDKTLIPNRSKLLFARFTGTLEWFCPLCEHFNRSRFIGHRGTWWKVRCKFMYCRVRFIVGVRLMRAAKGRKMPPEDVVFIPDVPIKAWRSGQPANRYIAEPIETDIETDNTNHNT